MVGRFYFQEDAQVAEDQAQEAVENQPQPDDQPAGGQEPQKAKAEKTFSADYVTELRAEAAKYRTELRELRQAQEAQEQQALTEQGKFKELAEKAQVKLAEMERKLEEQQRAVLNERRLSTVVTVAAELNAIDPQDPNFDIATRDIDPAGDRYTEKIREALAQLKEAKPYLFRLQQQPGLTPFNPSGQAGQVPESREQRRNRIYGGADVDIWSSREMGQQGGGVVWNTKP